MGANMGANIELDPPPRPFRITAPKSIGESMRRVIAPAIGTRSQQFVQLVLWWPSIVGEELAQLAQPLKLVYAGSAPTHNANATARAKHALLLQVPRRHALEVEYSADTIVQRVNTWAGRDFISGLRLRVR